MEDNVVSKDWLQIWGEKIYSLLERNDLDTAKNSLSIEDMKKHCNICSSEVKSAVAQEIADRRLAIKCLESLLESKITKLELETKIDSAVVKVKLAMWGALGGVVMSVLVQVALKLLF